MLDVHADADHHRAVFTLAGEPGELHRALAQGARVAVERIDLRAHAGVHPRVGALDVAPDRAPHGGRARGGVRRGAAARPPARQPISALPVYLYGALAGGRARAALRRPGALEQLAPDYGPPRPHPTAGATLVAARPPLVAFNVELAPPATLADAKRIAALIREGGEEGLPGVRALGLQLASSGLVQISTNIEDPARATAGMVVAAVARHAAGQRGGARRPRAGRGDRRRGRAAAQPGHARRGTGNRLLNREIVATVCGTDATRRGGPPPR